MKVNHIPERLCVVCKRMKPKGKLLRMVKLPSDKLSVDTTGKTPGRGLYLCCNRECLNEFLTGKKFRKRFHCSLREGSVEELMTIREKLPPENKD